MTNPSSKLLHGMAACALLLLLTGCFEGSNFVWRVEPISVASPTAQPVEMEGLRITAASAHRIRRTGEYASGPAGPVVGLKFTPDGQRLHAAYADEGILRTWALSDTHTPVRAIRMWPVGLGAVSFSANADTMASGAGVNWEERIEDSAYEGLRIWNVETGNLIRQFPPSPRVMTPVEERGAYITLVLSPRGDWTIMSGDLVPLARSGARSLSTYGTYSALRGCGYARLEQHPGDDDYDALAIDANADLVAGANRWGQVALFRFQPPGGCLDTPHAYVERPSTIEGTRPAALAFDPQRRWLARVQGAQLTIWQLQSLGFPALFSASLGTQSSQLAGLAFSPDGNILAIASQNGCQLWDVAGRKQLSMLTSEPGYSVDFSRDGINVACGAADGTVQVFSVSPLQP